MAPYFVIGLQYVHVSTVSGVVGNPGPFYLRELTLIPAWISNHSHYDVWNGFTYPSPSLDGWAVEVWGWICNFIPQFIGHEITFPC